MQMFSINNLTWKCHICGERRPDEKISVFSRDDSWKYELPPGSIKTNVRYCNDNPSCQEKAKSFDHNNNKKE